MRITRLLLCIVVALALTASSTVFAGVMVPGGLAPGDTYRLIFVTEGVIEGNHSFSDFNQFVTDQANQNLDLLTLGTTWSAIVSSHSITALSNTLTSPNLSSQSPIYLIDGRKIADNYTDLWDGSIDHSIDITQFGDSISVSVWTGTRPDGRARAGLVIEPGAILGLRGLSNAASSSWVDDNNALTETLSNMYGISGILTVPQSQVPEPNSIIMVIGLASCGAIGGAIRRRHRFSIQQYEK